MQEEWKDIPGFEGRYMVSNFCNVKSLNYRGLGKERVLKLGKTGKGYPKISLLTLDGNNNHFMVHRLVMMVFVGKSTLQVNHKDGDKTNNRLDNLEYCTDSENKIHAITMLGTGRGSRNGFSKLIESDVQNIKALLRDGKREADIAKVYGVSRSTIGHIKTGACWGWLK